MRLFLYRSHKFFGYWWYRMVAWFCDWPAWSIEYTDGYSYPLRYDDAKYRCELFGGVRLHYIRDYQGNYSLPLPRSCK